VRVSKSVGGIPFPLAGARSVPTLLPLEPSRRQRRGVEKLRGPPAHRFRPAAPIAAIVHKGAAAARVRPNSGKRPPTGRPLLSLRAQMAIGCACSPQGARPRSKVPPTPHGGSGPVFTADCGCSMGLPVPDSDRRPDPRAGGGSARAHARNTLPCFRTVRACAAWPHCVPSDPPYSKSLQRMVGTDA
jgi:hypothetical protein